MKTVTPEQLQAAYEELYPAEKGETPAYRNWLEGYHLQPERQIATQNWYGKVTKALFKALGIKQPRLKRDMLAALQ